MKPVKGVSCWTPLQQHVAHVFFNSNSKHIAYEMKRREGSTTLLCGIVANLFFQKFKGRVVLYTLNQSRTLQSILPMIDGTGLHLTKKTEERICTEETVMLCVKITLPDYHTALHFADIVLIDAEDGCINDSFANLLQNTHACAEKRTLITHSGNPPLRGWFLSERVSYFKRDYPNAARRAIHAWIVCARRMSFHRNIIPVIAQYVEGTRHDTCWLNLEYPLK